MRAVRSHLLFSRALASLALVFGILFSATAVQAADVQSSVRLSNSALRLMSAGRFAEAEPLMRSALEAGPDLAIVQTNMGYLLNHTGRAEEAIEHLKRAIALAPNQAEAYVNLDGAYQTSGQLELAVNAYRAYLQFANLPDRAMVSQLVAQLELELGRQAKAGVTSDGGTNGYMACVSGGGKYRWGKQKLSVYLPVNMSAGQQAVVLQAFSAWEKTGVLSFERSADAASADISFTFENSPAALASLAEGGEATFKHRAGTIVHADVRLLAYEPNSGRAWHDSELYGLSLHEIGHALGLHGHSPNANDVMFCTVHSVGACDATGNGLSSGDVLTLKALYEGLPVLSLR